VDKIVHEPPGGAHRDHEAMMQSLKKAVQESWRQLKDKPLNELLEARFERLIGYGKFKEAEAK
jgi:acetyl-CoA carboxylase carboxyl transferase subunit alpha